MAAAQPILVQAALDAAPVDPGRARRILAGAAEAAWLEADRNAGADLSRAAARLGPADSAHDRYFADLTAGFLAFLEGDLAAAVRLLTDAIGLAGRLRDPDLLSLAAHHAFYVGDDTAAYQLNVRVAASARAGGKAAELLFTLPRLAQAELLTGRWAAAAASAGEAVRLATETGQPALSALPLAWLTLLAAIKGDDAFWSRVAETEQVTAASALGVFQGAVRDVIGWARAVQKAATARPASAGTLLGELRHPVVVTMASLDGVEAAVHAGRRNSALGWLRGMEAFATHTAAPWAQARVTHAHGLLSEGHVAEGRFQEALDHHRGPGARSNGPALSWPMGSCCAGRGAGSTPGPTSRPPSTPSRTSGRRRGPSGRGWSCEPAGRPPAGATRRRSSSSRRRSSRWPGSSPPGYPPGGRRPAVPQPPDGRVPPPQRLRQARHQLQVSAGPVPPRLIRPRTR